MKRETVLRNLIKMYLRTFPPISKHGNGIIGNLKRFLLIIPIKICVGGDLNNVEEFLEREFQIIEQ